MPLSQKQNPMGNFPEFAVNYWDSVINEHPEFARAYYWRGRLKMDLQDLTGALEDFNKAIGLDPAHAYAYEQRALVQESLGHFEAAKNDKNKFMELEPKTPDFSADYESYRITGISAGTKNPYPKSIGLKGKIYVSKEKQRREYKKTVTIIRKDKGVSWSFCPGENYYVESSFFYIPGRGGSVLSEEANPEDVVTFLGQERIEGRLADKYRLSYNDTFGNLFDHRLQWVDAETGIHIKTRPDEKGYTVTYRNIKVEKQPDSLFEVPESYKKVKTIEELILLEALRR